MSGSSGWTMLNVTVLTRSSDARNDHSPAGPAGVGLPSRRPSPRSFSSCLKIAKPSGARRRRGGPRYGYLRWAPLPLKSSTRCACPGTATATRRPALPRVERVDGFHVSARRRPARGARRDRDRRRCGRRSPGPCRRPRPARNVAGPKPTAVDRRLGCRQCRNRNALRHGVVEVVLDHPAQQAAAPVCGTGRDVGDHPQREQLPAGVQRLVEAGVRRDRHRSGAEIALGQPRTADDDLVRAVVAYPPFDELVLGARVAKAAQDGADPAVPPDHRLVRLVGEVEDREVVVHPTTLVSPLPAATGYPALSPGPAAAPPRGPTRSAPRHPWRPGRG